MARQRRSWKCCCEMRLRVLAHTTGRLLDRRRINVEKQDCGAPQSAAAACPPPPPPRLFSPLSQQRVPATRWLRAACCSRARPSKPQLRSREPTPSGAHPDQASEQVSSPLGQTNHRTQLRPNCKALPRQSLCSSSRSVLPCCVSTASQHQRRELRLASVSASEELTRIGSNRHAAYQPTLLQAGRHRCVRYAGAGPCIVL